MGVVRAADAVAPPGRSPAGARRLAGAGRVGVLMVKVVHIGTGHPVQCNGKWSVHAAVARGGYNRALITAQLLDGCRG